MDVIYGSLTALIIVSLSLLGASLYLYYKEGRHKDES